MARFGAGAENDLVLESGSITWGFLSRLLFFFLELRIGIEMDLIPVVVSHSFIFRVGDRIKLRYSVGIEIDLFLYGGSKLSVRAEID